MDNGRVKEHDGYYCIRHSLPGENVYTQIDGKQPRTKSKYSNPKLIQLEKERNELRQEKSKLNLKAEVFKREYIYIERKLAKIDIQIEIKEREIAAFTQAPAIRDESEDDDYEEADGLYSDGTRRQLMMNTEFDDDYNRFRDERNKSCLLQQLQPYSSLVNVFEENTYASLEVDVFY